MTSGGLDPGRKKTGRLRDPYDGDIAMASLRSEDWLYKMFGIDAELLIDHAWGYEHAG